jgi:hypothetical protein
MCDTNWLPNYVALDFHISHKLKKPELYADDIKYLTKVCSKNRTYIDLLEKIIILDLPGSCEIIKTVIQNSQCYDNICILFKKYGMINLYIYIIEHCNDDAVALAFINDFGDYSPNFVTKAMELSNYYFIKNILKTNRLNEIYLRIFLRDKKNRIWLAQNRNIHSMLYEHIISKHDCFTIYVNKLFTKSCTCPFEFIQNSILNDISVLQKITVDKRATGIIKCFANEDGLKILQWLNQRMNISLGMDTDAILKKILTSNNKDMIIFLIDVLKIDLHNFLYNISIKEYTLFPYEFSDTSIQICYDMLDYSKLYNCVHCVTTYRFMYHDIRFLMKHLKYCPDDSSKIKTLIEILYISSKNGSNQTLNPILSKMLCDKYASFDVNKK